VFFLLKILNYVIYDTCMRLNSDIFNLQPFGYYLLKYKFNIFGTKQLNSASSDSNIAAWMDININKDSKMEYY
jgi:hypothetical protein